MECPHCGSSFDDKPHYFALGEDPDGSWQVSNVRCPVCDHLVISLCTKEGSIYPIWPISATRYHLNNEVPADYAIEYRTATQIMHLSPEASATISRRALHRFLAAVTQAGDGSLFDQIQRTAASPNLPTYIKQALQTLIRVARLEPDSPKSLCPEALCGAEAGEPEWLLEVLQALFDLHFVQPARMQRRQEELEATLASIASAAPFPPAAPSCDRSPTETDNANGRVVEGYPRRYTRHR